MRFEADPSPPAPVIDRVKPLRRRFWENLKGLQAHEDARQTGKFAQGLSPGGTDVVSQRSQTRGEGSPGAAHARPRPPPPTPLRPWRRCPVPRPRRCRSPRNGCGSSNATSRRARPTTWRRCGACEGRCRRRPWGARWSRPSAAMRCCAPPSPTSTAGRPSGQLLDVGPPQDRVMIASISRISNPPAASSPQPRSGASASSQGHLSRAAPLKGRRQLVERAAQHLVRQMVGHIFAEHKGPDDVFAEHKCAPRRPGG